MNIQHSTDLVAIDQPFERMYWKTYRIGWGEGAAQESRLRSCANDLYFHMWHCTAFFLDNNIQTVSHLSDSTHQLSRLESSGRFRHVHAYNASVHPMQVDRNLAWHPHASPRT